MLQSGMSNPPSLLRNPGQCIKYGRPLLGAPRPHYRRHLGPTRVICGEEKVAKDVKKALMKARKSLKKSLCRIEKELGEEASTMDMATESDDGSMSMIYAAQKELYERELARWDEERKMWDEREQALLSEMQRLQGIVVKLASRGSQSPVDVSQESAAQTAPTYPAPETMTAGTESPDASTEAPQFFGSTSAVQDESVSSVAASMSAAFAAVNQGDVLSDNFPDLHKELEESFMENRAGSTIILEDYPQTSGEGASDAEIEVMKSPPTGPPPDLVEGDDDIYWVCKLHQSLEKKGFFCGEEDCEDFIFAQGTTTALLSFQACEGLTETGIADEETWIALLGDEAREAFSRGKVTPETGEADAKVTSDTSGTESNNAMKNLTDTDGTGGNGAGQLNHTEVHQVEDGIATTHGLKMDPKLPTSKGGWPVIQESDGGKEVHALHICLENNGFHCGDDDMNWWYFGDDTATAVKTFQACNGLPESGRCNEQTWLALLGEDANSDVLKEITSDNSYDEDRTAQGAHTGGVWLLGEQRWEKGEKF